MRTCLRFVCDTEHLLQRHSQFCLLLALCSDRNSGKCTILRFFRAMKDRFQRMTLCCWHYMHWHLLWNDGVNSLIWWYLVVLSLADHFLRNVTTSAVVLALMAQQVALALCLCLCVIAHTSRACCSESTRYLRWIRSFNGKQNNDRFDIISMRHWLKLLWAFAMSTRCTRSGQCCLTAKFPRAKQRGLQNFQM